VLPQVAGYVRKIHVKPGQEVAAGAVLAEVDSREESAALRSASAQAQSARSRLALARRSMTRTEGLYKEGIASGAELDQARAELASAEAAVRAAGAEVSQRQVALSNHDIRAPVPGVIGDVQIRLGDYVSATTPLTTIAEGQALELSIAVPAARARKLAVGAPVEILAEDGSVLVTSELFYVAPEAEPRTQLVEVKAAIDNTVGLRPQELVRARVVYATGQAVQIPLLAVVRQSGQAFVLAVVERDGQLVVERRPVQLGELGAGGYRLLGGIEAGEKIAVSSLQALRDGAAVTIQGKQEQP
jgi:RND family efflux transporter MFP subunit